jgi:CubicO group peptidase (beta-lactamase class C family)
VFERALPPLLCLLLTAAPSFAESADWPAAAPEEAGFAPDLADRIDAVLRDESSAKVHSIVVIHDGRLVYERYLSGDDEKLGWTVKGRTFDASMKHDVRSITKSVVSLLYGIALAEGSVPPLDAALVDSFPEYPEAAADPAKRKMTVGDALSMSLGLEWNEDAPGDENSETQMEDAPDLVRFVLERPVAAEPGAVWVYNGGATSLLARIVARGTGMPIEDFARARLFGPLGIEDVEWVSDYYGVPWANSGLRLRPRDLAKIGQLVLDGGRWDGAQVVPEDWIAASTRPSMQAGDTGCGYGYHWWLCRTASGIDVVEGAGRGGQEVLILPSEKLVFVATGGDYRNPDAWKAPWRILEEVVLPSLN